MFWFGVSILNSSIDIPDNNELDVCLEVRWKPSVATHLFFETIQWCIDHFKYAPRRQPRMIDNDFFIEVWIKTENDGMQYILTWSDYFDIAMNDAQNDIT